MKSVKRVVNIMVIVYLLFALLLILNVLNRELFISLFNQNNLESFYAVLFYIGAFLLALEIVVEMLNVRAIKRSRQLDLLKITELKAKLYDQKQEFRDMRPGHTPATNEGQTIYPPADDEPDLPPVPNRPHRP